MGNVVLIICSIIITYLHWCIENWYLDTKSDPLTAICWYWLPALGTKSCGSAVLLELLSSHVTRPVGSFRTLIEKHSGMSTQSQRHFIGAAALTVFNTWFCSDTPSSLTNFVILHPETKGNQNNTIHFILKTDNEQTSFAEYQSVETEKTETTAYDNKNNWLNFAVGLLDLTTTLTRSLLY